jgi:succinyl-diaminopimelate desuccinylase
MTKLLDKERIKKTLAALDRDELIKLTADLVRLNTVWDPEAGTSEQPAADLVAAWAEAEGFAFQMDQVAPGRSNVIITLEGAPGERTLMFEGHTDVVTPGDLSAWTCDPVGAEIVGTRMYGRGTNDTKGNTAAMLLAMAAIKRAGVEFSGRIKAGVLCDEEDRMLGVNDFIARGHADEVTGAIICEPEENFICCTQKGAIRAVFTLTGRQSHGAMPHSGLNTAPALAFLIQGLAELERVEVETHHRDELLGWPQVTPTVIQAPDSGPAQLNVMPGQSRIQVDLRTIPAQSHPHLMKELTALAAKAQRWAGDYYRDYDSRLYLDRPHGLKVGVEFLTDRPATLTDRNDPLVKSVHRATEEITGKEPVYAGVPGATDGTWLWAKKDIPIVTIGAGDREVPHQVDEWVDLDQLFETARIYVVSALDYLRPDEG